VNLDFLRVGLTGQTDAVAHTPMERLARGAGARFEVRDGWNVAVEFPGGAGGTGSRDTVGWADVSHLAKVELQGPADAIDAAAGGELPFSAAVRRDDAWWCRLTQTRALVIGAGGPGRGGGGRAGSYGVDVLDVTSNFAAITLVGPLARETFARFCALDLRPQVTPVNGLRPGSVGRQPGLVIREDEDRYLFLFGWATGEYMWSVVADAGGHLGGAPIGVDALKKVATANA
jgi:glycine cleavage system aminomethyltransferase T